AGQAGPTVIAEPGVDPIQRDSRLVKRLLFHDWSSYLKLHWRRLYRFLIPLVLFVPLACPQESQLDASPSLFSVLAAINAAGYDAALDSPSNHPLREQVRAEIARRKPPVLFDLQRFYKEHKQRGDLAELSQYVSFALSTTGPPDFKS